MATKGGCPIDRIGVVTSRSIFRRLAPSSKSLCLAHFEIHMLDDLESGVKAKGLGADFIESIESQLMVDSPESVPICHISIQRV